LISQIINIIQNIWSIQLFRFFIVGGINTLFGYGVFALFTLLHLHYVVATLLATICGILFNFKTTGALVFKNKSNRLIFRFFAVYLVYYLLNIGLLKLFDWYHINSLIAQAIIILPLSLMAFFLLKKSVFQKGMPKPAEYSQM
jgi:putative flippase GtrA